MRLIGLVVGALLLCSCSIAGPPTGAVPSTDVAVLEEVFAGLGAGPFDTSGELTFDGRRVLDVLMIQGALLRARSGADRSYACREYRIAVDSGSVWT